MRKSDDQRLYVSISSLNLSSFFFSFSLTTAEPAVPPRPPSPVEEVPLQSENPIGVSQLIYAILYSQKRLPC